MSRALSQHRKSLTNIGQILLFVALCISLVSCFTGIESTKTITLSREDKKLAAPTEEEKFFSGIESLPLGSWPEGKEFLVTDDKALLMLGVQPLPGNIAPSSIAGETIKFELVEPRMSAAGNLNAVVVFTDGNSNYFYNTGKEYDQSLSSVTSDAIPMLIDLSMVEAARNRLVGKKLWTRSPLWYDSQGERVDGKRYVEVTIEDVLPGNMVFPLKLKIKSNTGDEAYMLMNFGNSGLESRSFHNLFSLSDIRKQYPHVQPETWDLISEGKVKAGMTKEECKLSIGNPKDINSGHDYSQTLDIWTYEDGTVLWFEDGLLTRFRR